MAEEATARPWRLYNAWADGPLQDIPEWEIAVPGGKSIARVTREEDAQLIVTAVNSHDTLELEERETPGASEAFTALDLADSLIERAYGTDVPAEWKRAIKKVARARTALEQSK
jgi:hypothetical protein